MFFLKIEIFVCQKSLNQKFAREIFGKKTKIVPKIKFFPRIKILCLKKQKNLPKIPILSKNENFDQN